jgi:hypothetical protein
MWAIVLPEFVGRFRVIGPFDSREQAKAYAEKNHEDHVGWNVAPMSAPVKE